jgi:hypothetical protein
LPAAVDAELATERSELSPILEVIVKHMRDGAEGTVVRSRAIVIPLDPGQSGKERSSIVIVPEDTPEISRPGKQGGRPDAVTPKWHEALFAALNAYGNAFRTDSGVRVNCLENVHSSESRSPPMIDSAEIFTAHRLVSTYRKSDCRGQTNGTATVARRASRTAALRANLWTENRTYY